MITKAERDERLHELDNERTRRILELFREGRTMEDIMLLVNNEFRERFFSICHDYNEPNDVR